MAVALQVRNIYEHTEVMIQNGNERSLSQQTLPALNRGTFKDRKWENALASLRGNGLAEEEHVREILLEGARTFGMWRVSEPALQALVAQVLESERDEISDGLQSWVSLSRKTASAPLEAQKALMDLRPARLLTVKGDPRLKKDHGIPGQRCARFLQSVRQVAAQGDAITLVKWGLAMVMTGVCLAYASWVVWVKYAGILDLFSWWIFFARAGGLATAIITGLLYLTMARTSMKQAYKLLSANSKVLKILDGHKDVHLFLAKCLCVASFIHVVSHLFSTVPALRYGSAKQLNGIIACADREHKLRGWPSLAWLQWPACPLSEEHMGWGNVLFQSTPGLSGLALMALLLLLGWTGRAKARSQEFDRFWYAHNLVVVAWPLAMFVHGSNQWIGVGFPLVAFTASVPICMYAVDRLMRLLRYYLYGGRTVKIASAVIRPGKGGGPSGALTHLQVLKPPGLWAFVPGMYAFVNMPDYAPLQWHPFTICSGRDDEHVEFIISGVGDWTQELAARCLGAQFGECALPRVALDGPYAAPTQRALASPVLVTVGAGVGITPFLSLLSSLISFIEGSSESEAATLPLKEAHFFWMTRSVDEFLFGRSHFTRIARSPVLRRKIHLHLHCTAREAEGDAAAYLFRQAVKRQSSVDREAFAAECDGHRVLVSLQLPWCWVNRSQLDVMWLSDLTTADCGVATDLDCDLEEVDDALEGEQEEEDAEQQVPPEGAAEEGPADSPVSPFLPPCSFAVPVTTSLARSIRKHVSRTRSASSVRFASPVSSTRPQRRPHSTSPAALAPQQRRPRIASPALVCPTSSLPARLSLPIPIGPKPSLPTQLSGRSARQADADWVEDLLRIRRKPTVTSLAPSARRPSRSPAAGVADLERGASSPPHVATYGSQSRGTRDCVSHSNSNAYTTPSHQDRQAEEELHTQSVYAQSSRASLEERLDTEVMVAVAFGRPDFEAELRCIGKHWQSHNKVHIYVCGNDAIVQGLRRSADTLNAEARANAKETNASKSQKYIVAYERFG